MRKPKSLGRSFLAIIAGFLAVVVLSVGVDAIMHGTGIFPPLGSAMSDSLFALALSYRTLIGIFGGYLTARLAPERPLSHALLYGLIGFVISALGAVVTWDKGPAFGPHWYPLALTVTTLPTAWAGFKLSGKE